MNAKAVLIVDSEESEAGNSELSRVNSMQRERGELQYDVTTIWRRADLEHIGTVLLDLIQEED